MPARARHRIVIDTNLWISFLLSRDYSKVDLMLSDDNIVLLFSQELIDEFLEVAQRPKFKKYFSRTDLQELVIKIRTKAEFVAVTSEVDLCRDPKDNFLLSLTQDGKATYLLTGDKDLLVLKKIGKTKIMKISEYFSTQ